MVDKNTRKARKRLKKEYGVSYRKARKMPLDKFANGPVLDGLVKKGVKRAKRNKWRLF